MAFDVFGNLNKRQCWTDDIIKKDDEIMLVNSNCEFEFDTKLAVFQSDLMRCYICKLELLETDYNQFIPDKSNNGGAYAYATARVVEVLEETY